MGIGDFFRIGNLFAYEGLFAEKDLKEMIDSKGIRLWIFCELGENAWVVERTKSSFNKKGVYQQCNVRIPDENLGVVSNNLVVNVA